MLLYYLLVVVLPLSEHHFWAYDFGASITPFKILGAICILYAAVALLFRGRLPVFLEFWQARLFIVLYAIVTVQCLANPGPRASNTFLHWTSFLLLLFLTSSLVSSVKRLRWTLYSAFAGIVVASAYMLHEWQTYRSVWAGFRPSGATGDPNYFALAAVCFLPMAFWLLIRQRSKFERIMLLGACVITMAALAAASSRGGFLALAAAIAFMVVRQKHRLRNLILAAIVLVPLCFAPGGPLHRMLHPSYGDEYGTNARITTWKAALNMMQAHPLLGIGPGNFKAVVENYQDSDVVIKSLAHNTYLEMGAELGIPMVVLYVVLGVVTYRSLEATRRRAMKASRFIADAAFGLQAGLIGCAVGIFFLTAEHQKGPWLLILDSPGDTGFTRPDRCQAQGSGG
jgi:O-antigen ligase